MARRRDALRTFSAAATAAKAVLLLLLLLLTATIIDARNDRSSIARSVPSRSGPFRAARATGDAVTLPSTREVIRQTRGGAAGRPGSRSNKLVNNAKAKAAATAPTAVSVAPTLPTALSGAVVMALLEQAVKALFKKNGVSFPAPLASCLLVLVFLLLLEPVNGGAAAAIFAPIALSTFAQAAQIVA